MRYPSWLCYFESCLPRLSGGTSADTPLFSGIGTIEWSSGVSYILLSLMPGPQCTPWQLLLLLRIMQSVRRLPQGWTQWRISRFTMWRLNLLRVFSTTLRTSPLQLYLDRNLPSLAVILGPLTMKDRGVTLSVCTVSLGRQPGVSNMVSPLSVMILSLTMWPLCRWLRVSSWPQKCVCL